MAFSITRWSRRVKTVKQDPYRWLADGLAGSGLYRWLALVTVPLWLTPALYGAHLRDSSSGLSRKLMWAAAGVWLGTMTLMGLPFTALFQAPLAQLGRMLGYWDDTFATPVVAALLTATSFVVLLAVAALEWALVWTACGIDMLIGSRTITPPPFGYVAIKVAGAMAGVAALTSGMLFLAKPLNDPVWHWIDTAGLVQTLLIVTFGAVLMLGHNREVKTTQTCGEQIYGSRAKAMTYQLAFPVALAAVAYFINLLHSNHL